MSKIMCPLMDKDVKEFCCANASIEKQIEESYFTTLLKQAYGYQIIIDDKVVGYYMLYFRNINLRQVHKIMGEEYESDMLDYYIAMHIRYLAIDKKLQHLGIGTAVLKGLIVEILRISKIYPIRVITIDALLEYHEWYRKIGFRDSPGCMYDGITVPMFIDCMTKEENEKLQNYCYECM